MASFALNQSTGRKRPAERPFVYSLSLHLDRLVLLVESLPPGPRLQHARFEKASFERKYVASFKPRRSYQPAASPRPLQLPLWEGSL
jgi:hypothetical protein